MIYRIFVSADRLVDIDGGPKVEVVKRRCQEPLAIFQRVAKPEDVAHIRTYILEDGATGLHDPDYRERFLKACDVPTSVNFLIRAMCPHPRDLFVIYRENLG